MIARVRHELTRRPSSSTVQAPHCPWSQPFLLPVRFSCSRRASSRVVQGATSICLTKPLTVNLIRAFGGNGAGGGATAASFVCVLIGPPAQGYRHVGALIGS